MKARFQSLFESIQEDPKRLAYLLASGLVLFWILRGCIPGLDGNTLPGEVWDEIQREHIACIRANDTPVWPGEGRQPECGQVELDLLEEGVVPPSAQAAGVSRVLCYQVTVENPRWQTMGQTRHEVLWSSRSYSKVALLQNGEWQTYPNEDRGDERRWLEFRCPGQYAPK
jgi:hypothetical protein